MAATSNATLGIFASGYNSSYNQTSVYKYTIASNAVAAGTAITTGRSAMGAAGTPTVGVYSGGSSDGTTILNKSEVYTYGSDAWAAGTNLGSVVWYLAAAGNSSLGIFSGGEPTASTSTAATNRYIYVGNTVTAGTNLTTTLSGHAGTSSSPGGF